MAAAAAILTYGLTGIDGAAAAKQCGTHAADGCKNERKKCLRRRPNSLPVRFPQHVSHINIFETFGPGLFCNRYCNGREGSHKNERKSSLAFSAHCLFSPTSQLDNASNDYFLHNEKLGGFNLNRM